VPSHMHAAAASVPAEREEARKTMERKGSSVNCLVRWFLSFCLKRHLYWDGGSTIFLGQINFLLLLLVVVQLQ
jgi:hypothetical protein